MTIFSKIIAGEIPCYKIAEDEKFFAFLDIFPLVKGHVLITTKIEVDRLFDLPDAYLNALLVFAKPIAQAIEKSFSELMGIKCTWACGTSSPITLIPHRLQSKDF